MELSPKELLLSSVNFLELTEVVIVFLEPDGTVSLINQKGCDLLGYSREELIGTNWIETVIPPHRRKASQVIFEETMKGLRLPMTAHENEVLTKDGETRYINWSITAIKNGGETVSGALGTGIDITDMYLMRRHLAQQELQRRKSLLAAVLEAQEAERLAIATELHDNVGQLLTSSRLMLEEELANNSSIAVRYSYDTLQKAINEIRELTHSFNPSQLEDLGLVSSLQELVQKLATSKRFSIQLQTAGNEYLDKLPPLIALTTFRIAQEALNNIIRHSGAKQVQINLSGAPNTLDLEIRDNGIGFVLAQTKKGLGLKNIYNRAELLAGSVYISSTPGEGTLLSVCIPLQENGEL